MKICTNKQCTEYGKDIWDDTDVICTECGTKLSPAPADTKPVPAGAPSSPDRSLTDVASMAGASGVRYKSNDTSIAGNQINAQAVDNSTTTVTNITSVQDEGHKIVTCAISGEQLYRIDTIECPKCRRLISKRYYDFDKLCCKQCAQREEEEQQRRLRAKQQEQEAQRRAEEEKRINEERLRLAEEKARIAEEKAREAEKVREAREKVIAPVIRTDRPQEFVRAERIETSSRQDTGDGGSTAKKFLIPALVLILIAGAAGLVMTMKDSGAPATGEPVPTIQPASQQTEVPSTLKAEKKAAEQTVAPAPKVEKKAEPKVPAKESPFEAGVKAYKAAEYTKANLLLEKALASGNNSAAYYLANMYKKGNGVSRNARKAFSYMKQAAEGGCADAYYALAEMYRTGDGTEPNRTLAKKWYEESALSSGQDADKAAKALERYR